MGSRCSSEQDHRDEKGIRMQMLCAAMLLLIVQCNHCIRM